MTDPFGREYAYWMPKASEEDLDKHFEKCEVCNTTEKGCGFSELVVKKNKKYTYTTEYIENRLSPEGYQCWNSLNVSILNENGEKVTEYLRNYHSMYETFFPFTLDGQDYALYSNNYTGSSLMELPSGKEIWSEPEDSFGFCPVEFYVPDNSPFGYVAGCLWGDDSSWKLEAIDLRYIKEGKIKRFAPFGYCPLSGDKSIIESISYFSYSIKNGKGILNANVITEYNFQHELDLNG